MAQPSAYDQLLRHLCVDLGFCDDVDSLIPQTGMVTANDFADMVFKAEGVESEKFREPIRDAFRRFLGSEAVDAVSLR